MTRRFSSISLLIIATALVGGTSANAQPATVKEVERPNGVLQPPGNTTANYTASGNYDIGGQGPIGKVTIQIRQTNGDGSNPIDFPESDAVLPAGNPGKGAFNASADGINFIHGKKYYCKIRIYNANGVVKGETGNGASTSPGWKEVTPPPPTFE